MKVLFVIIVALTFWVLAENEAIINNEGLFYNIRKNRKIRKNVKII